MMPEKTTPFLAAKKFARSLEVIKGYAEHCAKGARAEGATKVEPQFELISAIVEGVFEEVGEIEEPAP
jgi:hypothetical protein